MKIKSLSRHFDAITESDGAFRDINIRPITVTAAKGIFAFFSTSFILRDATDEDGNELLDIATINSQVENKQIGSVHSSWIGEKKWVSQIQLYLAWDIEGYECEISFFPEDIDKSIFTIQLFNKFLADLLNVAGNREYYVRYENASWRFGDCSKNSGVIFSHKDTLI